MKPENKKILKILIIIAIIGFLIFALIIAGTAGLIFFVMNKIADSPVSVMSFNIITSNETIQQELGTPIKRTWFIEGTVNNKVANMEYTVKGTKQKARVTVVSNKNTGEWEITYLKLTTNSGKRHIFIDKNNISNINLIY